MPRLVIDWLTHEPEHPYRCVNGTGVFADISGFTNLTEKLARRGKAGAEEMGDVLNAMFEQLLGAAYQYGAGLIKWGGDAVLLLFEGKRHAELACRAAFEMQRVMAKIGRLDTSAGMVRLRMSIGVHSGPLDFFLVGDLFSELIITGPGATSIAQMEKVAQAGEIVVSPSTVEALGAGAAGLLGRSKGGGILLTSPPDVPRHPEISQVAVDVDLAGAMCGPLRDHLLGGEVDAEHRNVAVAFIECLGTTELLAQKGSAALTSALTAFVNECQEAAEANEVTVLGSDIVEDGVKMILVAGAPINVGDIETRVLTATRRVIDAGGVLPVRAGVNCGRVFAGDYGPSYRRVYSITGDGVNLAARLMAKAQPSEIVITPAVLERSRTRFLAEPLDPFAVKGKTALIEASVLGSAVEGGTGVTAQLPLVGREHELGLLREAAANARSGCGQVVELVGPPGIGKSRLLNELVALTDANVLWANGEIYQRSTPYLPLKRLFRQQLGLEPDAAPDAVAQALEDLVRSVAEDLAPWLPLLGMVAGVDMPLTEEVRMLDGEGRRERLEWATSEALGRVLSDPCLFVFNDLYIMDVATIALVERLAADAASRPWLLITTRRSGADSGIDAAPHVQQVELAPLSGEAAKQLLKMATQAAPIPEHKLSALGRRASGNPLFLIELAAGANEIDNPDELPDSVEGVISARIDLLDRDQRRVLRAAAVLGMTVDVPMLRDVLRIDAKGADHEFDRWDTLAEFLIPEAPDQFEFAHHLVRDTAYEGLPFRRRSLLHGRVADALETRLGNRVGEQAALLSEHCFWGERFHAAWHYATRAADMAREAYANADAAQLYRRALAAADRLPGVNAGEFVTVCESLGTVYDDLGEFDAAEAVLARARRKVGDEPIRKARIELKTAIIRQRMGRYAVALQGLSRGLETIASLEGPEVERIRAALFTRYAWIRNFQGRPRDMIRWAERGIAEAQRCDEKAMVAHCLEIMEWGGINLGSIPDESPALKALHIYEEMGDVAGQASVSHTLGVREYYRGHWRQAIEHFGSAEDAYRRSGSIWGTVMPMLARAEILSDQGRQAEAEPLATEALRLARGANIENDMAAARVLLGHIAARSGRGGEALAFYEEARQSYASAGVASSLVHVDGLVAECRLFQGDAEGAFALADAALRRAKSLEGSEIIPLLERIRALARIARGEFEAGRDDLLRCVSQTRARGLKAELAWALRNVITLTDEAGPERAELERELKSLEDVLGLVAA